MDANQFGVRAGCPVDKPRNPTADLAGRDARKARKRGGLLFWLLFSWPRKRKVTRSPKAIDRFALELLLRDTLGQTRESDSVFEEGRKLFALASNKAAGDESGFRRTERAAASDAYSTPLAPTPNAVTSRVMISFGDSATSGKSPTGW